MAKLTFVLDDGQEVVVSLADRVTLGREDGNDVVVDDNRISGRHAELVRGADGHVEVRDLNSKAGTFVNGERVKRCFINHGDKLAFGPLSAVFDLEEPAATNGTVAAADDKPGVPGASVSDKRATAEKPAGKKKEKSEKKDDEPARSAPPAAEAAIPAEFFERLSAEQKESIRHRESEKVRTQADLEAVQKALGDWQGRVAKVQADAREAQRVLDETRALLAKTQTEEKEIRVRNEETRVRHEKMESQLREAAEEMRVKSDRVDKLRADEARLAQMTAAVQDAASAHQKWMESIKALSVQHEQKTAEVQRLSAAASAALHEVETVTAHKEQELSHLKEVRSEGEHAETRLAALEEQIAEQEARSADQKVLAEAREDQVKFSEKKLEQLDQRRTQAEARVRELTGIEEKLEKVLARCREAESNHAAVSATLASFAKEKQSSESMVADLQSRIGALQAEHKQICGATDEARGAQQRVEEILHRIHVEREAHENDLTAKRKELISEMQRLDEAKARRAEIARQCEELAGTDLKLAGVKQNLAAAEKLHTAMKAEIVETEVQRDKHKAILDDLCSEEAAAKGRIDVLQGRETELHAELERLVEAERSDRDRFEAMRKLTQEAEKEHAAQKIELARSIEIARRELADMELKLAPLRDWKDSMDKRYARLAALPEDSAEARELWHEIEKEKGNLKNLITSVPGQTRGVSLKEIVLRGIASGTEKKPEKGTLHAPPALAEDAETPEQRANVGATGTGAMFSGTGQEMALKARVSRLRESVQREAMRLEFLRQERAREETRTNPGPAGEGIMREQDRQLEAKIRREEERIATLQRKLELAEVEEEKRRDKVTELERKLAELRMDISDAERQRSDVRQQTDLAQTELKNYEAAIDRVKKMSE